MPDLRLEPTLSLSFSKESRTSKPPNIDMFTPPKTNGWIPKMVWKMYFLSNMAILGIHVRFQGGRSLGSLAFSRRIKGEIKVLHWKFEKKNMVSQSHKVSRNLLPTHPPNMAMEPLANRPGFESLKFSTNLKNRGGSLIVCFLKYYKYI